jgi:hypothetical protein
MAEHSTIEGAITALFEAETAQARRRTAGLFGAEDRERRGPCMIGFISSR